jgi:hypothetical protein
MVKSEKTMRLTPVEMKKKSSEALLKCTGGIPFLKKPPEIVEMEQPDLQVDLVASIFLPDGEKKLLLVDAENVGQPKVARDAVNRLLRMIQGQSGSYGIFIAPYISPRAAEICSKEGIGYLDLAGNCRLILGKIFIERTGNPNPFTEKRELRTLYSPKASRVIRVLLADPKKKWKLQELVEESRTSMGLVFNVKKLLVNREWVGEDRVGFELKEPEAVLKEWSQNYNYRKNKVEEFYSLKRLPDIEADLADILSRRDIRYALTGFSGAARIAPYARYQKATAYVEGIDEDIANLLDLKRVNSGANLSILTPYDDAVFYGSQTYEGIQVASPIQLFLDLIGYGGRGDEAAQAILEEVIRPTW